MQMTQSVQQSAALFVLEAQLSTQILSLETTREIVRGMIGAQGNQWSASSTPRTTTRSRPTRNRRTARVAKPNGQATTTVDPKFMAAVQKGATVAALAKDFKITPSAVRARLNTIKAHGTPVIHEGNTYRLGTQAQA